MYIPITQNMFINKFKTFKTHGFSKQGLKALYKYYQELEEDTGQLIRLDVKAICTEWYEHPIETALKAYGIQTVDQLYDYTPVIEILNTSTIIYQPYY